MVKVLVAGDWHANALHAINAIDYAAKNDATEIWQCGDFGYWPLFDLGKLFLKQVSNRLDESNIDLYFADGNHEHHPSLKPDSNFPFALPNTLARIRYVPRGALLPVGGPLRVMFIGGAASVDRKWRTPGHDWFSSETLSLRQIQRILASPPVDIVVAHDAPAEAELVLMKDVWPEEDIKLSDAHRMLMSELAKLLKPSLWLHGHYHQRATTIYDYSLEHGMRIECLAEDNMPLEKSTLLLEVDGDGWRIL